MKKINENKDIEINLGEFFNIDSTNKKEINYRL